jgi:hypothetical protein
MKTNQAWGWLAAGVLAAGLNASYYDGGIQWAHRIADRIGQRSEAVLAHAIGHADRFLVEARMLTARNESASCPWATAVARVQSRIARSQGQFDGFEAMSAREQAQLVKLDANREAQLARVEANRARMEAQFAAHAAHFRMATAAFAPLAFKAMPAPVVCPRVRVNIPQVPMVEMPVVPEIHVEMAGTGPV